MCDRDDNPKPKLILSPSHRSMNSAQFTVYAIAGFRNSFQDCRQLAEQFFGDRFLTAAKSMPLEYGFKKDLWTEKCFHRSKQIFYSIFYKKVSKKFININYDVLDLDTNIHILTQSLFHIPSQ
jgi:hypothetical protein